MLQIHLLFSMMALVVRIELLCRSIRLLSPNRANGVAVFEGSPIRYNRKSNGTDCGRAVAVRSFQ